MSLTYNEISSLTNKYFIPKLYDNIFTSNILFSRARKKWYHKKAGGESIMVPVAYATTTASAWYDGQDNLTTSANNQITAMNFDWKQIHAAITISGRDEAINSGSETQVVDFVKAKVELAEKTIVDAVGTGLYNDGTTDTKAIVGLRLAVDSAGTYGGISRTDYSWLSAQEDSSTTALSLAVMQGMFGDCTVGNSKPSVITTTQDIFDIVWGKLQPQQRWADKTTADAGFQNILFNGTPVVVDNKCPSSHMFFLNEDYLQFIVHPDRDFRFRPFTSPENQDVATAHILWMGALVLSNPRMCGKFGAITE